MSVGSTIGQKLDYGYPGGYAIQPDALISTHVNADNKEIAFGELVIYNDDKTGVKLLRADGFTMANFAGIATRSIKQPYSYTDQNKAAYQPEDAVSCFQRGIISIVCVDSEAKFGGDVYYRFETNDNTAKPIGFTSKADTTTGTRTVKLEGIQFNGSSDSRGVVAICIREKINA